MSKEQVVSFFHEAVNNKNLAEDIRRIVEGTSDLKTAANKLTFLAQEYGFEFTVEEAAAAIHSEDISFLSDEDLSNVVGGLDFMTRLVSSLISLFSAVGSPVTGVVSKQSSTPTSSNISNEVVVAQPIKGSNDTTVNTSINTMLENAEESEGKVVKPEEKNPKQEMSQNKEGPGENTSTESLEQVIVECNTGLKNQLSNKAIGYDEFQETSIKASSELRKGILNRNEKIKRLGKQLNSAETTEKREELEKKLNKLQEEKRIVQAAHHENQRARKDAELQQAIAFPTYFSIHSFLDIWRSNVANQKTSRALSKSFKENLKSCPVHHESECNGFTLNYGTEKYSYQDKYYVFIDVQEGSTERPLDQKTVKVLLDNLTRNIGSIDNKYFDFIIGPGINKIDKEAFKVDASAENQIMPHSVHIFSGISSIGAEAFANNTNLYEFSIENERIAKNATCSSIEDSAFKGCKILNKIDLKKVESVGNRAFEGCENLTEVYLQKVKHIGASAFSKCTSLQYFNVSEEDQENAEGVEINLDKVETVGEYAFENTQVNKISISESLKELGEGAFKDCEYLETVNIQSSRLGKEVLDKAFDAGVLDKLHEGVPYRQS